MRLLADYNFYFSRDDMEGQLEGWRSYKKARFIRATKKREAIHLTMITANGLLHNAYAGEVQCEVTADELFV